MVCTNFIGNREKYKIQIGSYGFSNPFTIDTLPQVGPVQISPLAGTYDSVVTCTLYCATSGASIRYTLNGSKPTSNSTLYTGVPFTINVSTTVKATAFKNGYNQAIISSSTYLLEAPLPVVEPFRGTYPVPFHMTVWCPPGTVGYENYRFTLEGTEPPDPMIEYRDVVTYHDWELTTPGIMRYKIRTKKNNIWSPLVYVTYYLRPTVTIRQVDSSGTSFGTWSRWESNTWIQYSDTSFIRPATVDTFKLKAYQDFKPGTNQKFREWDNMSAKYSQNYGNVPLTSSTGLIKAQFIFANNATIQAQLVEGGNPGGNIDFKDPWLIDTTDSYGSRNRGVSALFKSVPYSLYNIGTASNYKGVFLNQNPQNTPAYYSVRAPLEQENINDFIGYFQHWTKSNATLADSTNDTTAVVFNDTNATVTALYKAHLGSSVSTATAGGGRKIVQRCYMDNGEYFEIYYAVYPSTGSIWFTRRNTSDQPSWIPEVKLGEGINPSIARTGSGELRVVWEKEPVSGQRVVYYRSSTNDGTSWDAPVTIATTSQTYDATPVPLTTQNMRALWRGSNGLYASIYIVSPPQWIQSGVSGLSSIAQSPSVSTFKVGNDTLFGLVCQDTNKIKYCKIYYDPSYVVVTGLKELSASGTTGNINPTIASSEGNNDIVAAWENTNTHKVYAKTTADIGINWSTIYEFSHGTDQLSKPTVGYYNGICWIFCQSQPTAGDPHIVVSYQLHTMMADMGNGSMPNMLESSELNSFVLSTKGAAAPFAINPIITPYDVIEWSGNIGYDAEMVGLNYVTGTVTLSSGKTLTIYPGSEIMVSPGASLIINGTMNAAGNSSQKITFDCSSSPGSWGGIRFNSGSSGTVSYCDIKHATTGITCNSYLPTITYCTIANNSTGISISLNGTSNNHVSYDTIRNNSSCGIYVSKSSFFCHHNVIDNNGSYGINCTNTSSPVLSPVLYNNKITNNTTGLNCYISAPYLSVVDSNHNGIPTAGYNVIKQNVNGIMAAYGSDVYLGQYSSYGGYNSIYDNTGYAIYAYYDNLIWAQINWWNNLTPNIYQYSATVYSNYPLTGDNP
jgi:hypothetical protein